MRLLSQASFITDPGFFPFEGGPSIFDATPHSRCTLSSIQMFNVQLAAASEIAGLPAAPRCSTLKAIPSNAHTGATVGEALLIALGGRVALTRCL